MEIGIVGLGRMGANMARRLIAGGHRVVVTNRSREPIDELAGEGAVPAWDYARLVERLTPPRTVWLMLPAGDVTQHAVDQMAGMLDPGDLIVDGGNSYYKDSMRRAEALRGRNMHFVDAGVSGGIWGLKEGYSLMLGGDAESVERIRPVAETLAPAPDRGWGRMGPSGAGHFTKMVHNGIEYGMMQAIAEGFEIMHAKTELELDLAQVAEVWRYGSVVRSWLLDLTAAALSKDSELSTIKGWVADSGEGRWTVAEAIDRDIPAPVVTMSLLARLASRQEESYAAKLVAAMRNEFGGHAVMPEDRSPLGPQEAPAK